WTTAGYHTIGVATAARAAHGLETAAGIPSSTIDRYLLDIEHSPTGKLAPRTILIVDEAGMVATRALDRIVNTLANDSKLVLIGDHHQLPEIGAGGVLRAVAERAETPQLTENRRQVDVGERAALAEL